MLYFTRILRIKDSKKYQQQLDTLEINLLNGQLTIETMETHKNYFYKCPQNSYKNSMNMTKNYEKNKL